VIVFDQRERDVRPRLRERLDRPVVDRGVADALKDQRRLSDGGVERVVLQAVFVEVEAQIALGVLGVVEERQRAAAAPLVDAVGRQQVVPPASRTSPPARAAPGGRSATETGPAARIASVPPRLEPMSTAGSPSSDPSSVAKLLEHPRERQGREIGLVEVGAADPDAVLRQPIGEVGDLRARGEEAKPWR
jgi:hypothetical protein